VDSELSEVKGKTDKAISAARTRLLEALLSDNPDARYATPTATR
jgi:hypothetical protein